MAAPAAAHVIVPLHAESELHEIPPVAESEDYSCTRPWVARCEYTETRMQAYITADGGSGQVNMDVYHLAGQAASTMNTLVQYASHAARNSDVQFGQRVAASGTFVAQNGHSLVATAATGFLYILAAMRITRKTASATIKKVMMLLMNCP